MKPQEHAPMIKIRKGAKNPVLLPNRSKTPGHSSRFNYIKDFSSRSDIQGGPDDGDGDEYIQLHLLVGDDCVHDK